MKLWLLWYSLIRQLRSACTRERTFLWMCVVLIGFVIRPDLVGVTSTIRAVGLLQVCYYMILHLFHTPALNIDSLAGLWSALVIKIFPLVRIGQRVVIVGDGIKVPKSGKKMPSVKKLFQESESNTKPRFIFGHNCQAIAAVAGTATSCCAVPLICRIHEGVKYSNRDQRSFIDKMIAMLLSTAKGLSYYFVADAYYACRPCIRALLGDGNHLISRMRMNAVAYKSSPKRTGKKGRGRPKKYGPKIHLRTLFDTPQTMQRAWSPLYGEQKVRLRYRCVDLWCKGAPAPIRFVAVAHPCRGNIILMCTDIALAPLEIIRAYGLRFKIEVSFKQALHTVGAFGYHFWMKTMRRIDRAGKTQHLHRAGGSYRQKVQRKIAAYQRFMQLGLIAQGSLQYLSCCHAELVMKHFGSWIRTIREGILPSEMITATAMRNTFIDFMHDTNQQPNITKFIRERIDPKNVNGARLAA